jgi:hypothetical protein
VHISRLVLARRASFGQVFRSRNREGLNARQLAGDQRRIRNAMERQRRSTCKSRILRRSWALWASKTRLSSAPKNSRLVPKLANKLSTELGGRPDNRSLKINTCERLSTFRIEAIQFQVQQTGEKVPSPSGSEVPMACKLRLR